MNFKVRVIIIGVLLGAVLVGTSIKANAQTIHHEETITVVDKEAWTEEVEEIIPEGSEVLVDGDIEFAQCESSDNTGYATIYQRNDNELIYENGSTQYGESEYTYVGYAIIDKTEVWESTLVYDEANDQYIPEESVEKHILEAYDLDGNALEGLNAYVIKDHCGNGKTIVLNDGTVIGKDYAWHIDCVVTPFTLKVKTDTTITKIVEHEAETHEETISWDEVIEETVVYEIQEVPPTFDIHVFLDIFLGLLAFIVVFGFNKKN